MIEVRHSEKLVKYCNVCGKRFKRTDFYRNHISKCIDRNVEDFSDLFENSTPDLELDSEFPSFVTIHPSFIDYTNNNPESIVE